MGAKRSPVLRVLLRQRQASGRRRRLGARSAGRLRLQRPPGDDAACSVPGRLSSIRRSISSPPSAVPEHEAPLFVRYAAGEGPGEDTSGEHAHVEQRPDPDRLVAAEGPLDDQVPAEARSRTCTASRPRTGPAPRRGWYFPSAGAHRGRRFRVSFPTRSTGGSASRARGSSASRPTTEHADQPTATVAETTLASARVRGRSRPSRR